MFECNKFRIEVKQCSGCGQYRVIIWPVTYLGKEDFKAWMRLCKRSFMTLVKHWQFERVFQNAKDAEHFAKHLTRMLGEAVFLNLNETQIVAPKEVE